MSDLSRRSFLAGSAGVAAGATVLGGAVAPALAGASVSAGAAAAGGSPDGVLVYVRDAAAGDVVMMADQASTSVTDPALVAAVARALQAARS
jgi:hypothetical protein